MLLTIIWYCPLKRGSRGDISMKWQNVPSCCIWALIAVSTYVDGVNSQAGWLWGLATPTEHELLCGGWSHKADVVPAVRYLWWTRLDMPLVQKIGWCSAVVYTQPPGVLVLGPPMSDSSESECQVLPVASLGLPVRNYTVIHGWLLPVLGLCAHSSGQDVNLGWLLPVPSSLPYLLWAHKTQPRKEPLRMVWGRVSGSS